MSWTINDLPHRRSPEERQAYVDGFMAAVGMALKYADEGRPLTDLRRLVELMQETTGVTDRDDGLTDEEGAVADALVAAVQAYDKLPVQHPDETRDFVDAIHRCQDQLAMRIARRHYPQGWPVKEVHDAE
jgi:hypothetical protein